MMRTTLNIEEDALAYAKERARATGRSLGEVVTDALREVARPRTGGIELAETGMPFIPARTGRKPVTGTEVADALEQEEVDKHATARR